MLPGININNTNNLKYYPNGNNIPKSIILFQKQQVALQIPTTLFCPIIFPLHCSYLHFIQYLQKKIFL